MNDLYDSIEEKKKKRKKRKKAGSESSKESSLRDWFGRKGAKGKKKGWVDCNSPDGKGGYKSCGRGSGEKRKKYPACRPTPGACKERGKGKSWGKKAKKKSKKKNEELYMDLEQIIQEELENVLSDMKEGLQQESFIDAIVNRKTHQAGKKALAQLQVYANDPGTYKDSIESLYKDLSQLEKTESPAAMSLYDALKLARELRQKAASAPSSAAKPKAASDRYDIDSPERVKQRGDQRRRLSQYKKDQDDERRRAKQRARTNVRRGFDAGLVDYSDTLREAVMSENMSADELENQFVKMHQTNKGKMNGPMRVILQKLTKLSKQGRYHKNVQAALRKKIRAMEEEIALDEKKKKKKKKKKSSGKKDACYSKVKSRYKVWPSAYASGALVKCRKVGAANWGNSKKESIELDVQNEIELILQESHSKEHEEELKKIADELKGASKMHASQAERVEKILDETDDDELKETSFEEGGCGMDNEEPALKVAVKEELNCGCGKDPCETYGKNSEKFAIMVREELEAVVKEKKKKKACKPSKGKRFAKRVDGKCRSFGQKGKAKSGGDRIRPGTKKGDAYCARSAKIKKCKNPPCANALSRKKWKCRGSKSMKE